MGFCISKRGFCPWMRLAVRFSSFSRRLVDSACRRCDLRQILNMYASYYNELRTHRSPTKDIPLHRVDGTVKQAAIRAAA